jgi:hypothetical protein
MTCGARAVVVLLALVVTLAGTPLMVVAQPATDDAYIAGYATAIIERELRAGPRPLRVEGGVVTVDGTGLDEADRVRLLEALRAVRGVLRVEVVTALPEPREVRETRVVPGVGRMKVLEDLQTGVLPGGQLFKPLIADPRWPHFAAAHQYYLNERDLTNVAAVSFGETFSLYRDRVGEAWWEVGIQAGVFAVFDVDAKSKDLINADYLVGVFLGYRHDRFSALGRVFHQSSHLGDEFLLGNRIKNRVNLSYESFDLRLSYELLGDVLRPYVGGGYLFDQDPEDLKPGSVQWGLEFRSPWPGPTAAFRPIAAADIQNREENDWHSDLSLRAGVQFEGVLATRNLQILLEYFRGHSPNGQFYKQKVDYLGVGAHFHF